MLKPILPFMPPVLRETLDRVAPHIQADVEEVRIREARPLEILYGGSYSFVARDGSLSSKPDLAYVPGGEECGRLLELLTNHSLYSFEEELKRGFITVAGGHRVGLAGRTILENGRVKLIREVSGFNIRIAREVKGSGVPILPWLMDPTQGTVYSTLVISPPQQGKTTLIRDLARLISSGEWPAAGKLSSARGGLKVGIVDERSELAACSRGVPRFDVGPRTDVMDGCPKAEGMMMMIRSMSPEVMIVDEIGRSEDAAAINEAIHAGIRIIASAHGSSLEDVRQRPALRQLVEQRVFKRMVFLRKQGKAVHAEAVLDDLGRVVSTWSAGIKGL